MWFLTSKEIQGELVDISETGIGFSLNRAVTRGSRLRVSVKLPLANDTIEGDVVVHWRRPDGDKWFVGAEFVSVPDGQAFKIQCLRRLMMSMEWKQRATAARPVPPGPAPTETLSIVQNNNT